MPEYRYANTDSEVEAGRTCWLHCRPSLWPLDFCPEISKKQFNTDQHQMGEIFNTPTSQWIHRCENVRVRQSKPLIELLENCLLLSSSIPKLFSLPISISSQLKHAGKQPVRDIYSRVGVLLEHAGGTCSSTHVHITVGHQHQLK